MAGLGNNAGGNGGRIFSNRTAALRALWNNFLPALRDASATVAGKGAEIVWKTATKNDKAAENIGVITSKTVKTGITLSANIGDFVRVTRHSKGKLKELAEESGPVLKEEFGKASRLKLMQSENEVLAVQRARIMAHTKNGFYTAGAGLLDKVPDVFAYADRKRLEIQAGKQPKLADVLGGVGEKIDQVNEDVVASRLFNPESRASIETMVRTGAPAIQAYIAGQGEKRVAIPTAYEMIRDYAQQEATAEGRLSTVRNPANGEHLLPENYVLAVFKRHQQDMGGARIDAEYGANSALDEAAKAIATAIDQKRIDPMALVSLVGDRQIIDKEMQVASGPTVEKEISKLEKVKMPEGYWQKAVARQSQAQKEPESFVERVVGEIKEIPSLNR